MQSVGISHICVAITLFLLPASLLAQAAGIRNTGDAFVVTVPTTGPLQPGDTISAARAGNPKIGLVLSGGGSRGIAQIGVLRALEEAGIAPDFIVGTSVGSIVGGLYASGYSPHRLEQVIRGVDWNNALQMSDEADRTTLAVDQKPVSDRSIFSLRFDGLQPVIPIAVSNGQRLTNTLNELALQGTTHARSFDDLHVSFRAVAPAPASSLS